VVHPVDKGWGLDVTSSQFKTHVCSLRRGTILVTRHWNAIRGKVIDKETKLGSMGEAMDGAFDNV